MSGVRKAQAAKGRLRAGALNQSAVVGRLAEYQKVRLRSNAVRPVQIRPLGQLDRRAGRDMRTEHQ